MAEGDDLALLEDVTSSEAFKVLNELLSSGKVSADRADTAKHKYTALHGALVGALQAEKDLLDQAKALKRRKEEQEQALAGSGGVSAISGVDDIDQLREDVEAAIGEAALAQERQQLLQLEVTDLQRQRNELGSRMEELAAEHAVALQPVIVAARSEAAALMEDVEEERRRVDAAKSELADNLFVELKNESDHLNRRQREKELMLRQYRLADQQLKDARDVLPNLKFQVEQLHRDVNTLETKRKTQSRELTEVKRELDIQMAAFLHEESGGKDKVSLFQLTYKQVAALEAELAALKREESDRNLILRDLGSQRDRVALSIAQKLSKVKEVHMTSRIKEVELAELKKIRKEVGRRIRDFEKLYDLVKNQRNKFVNLIQTRPARLLGMVFRDKQSVVDEQISEVDKLNAIINGCEKEMLRLKKQYELVIEARNYTGIMLIDRNDELCVLYEKSNIQGEVIKGGQLELMRRDDEARLLRLEVGELDRSLGVTRRLVPSVPLLDTDVASLQKSLFEARREAEALSLALENPSNQSRWRLLEGKIPDREELSAKIQALEERLNDKKEQLLEKELILEEITSLSNKLRMQAAEGRADTLELAQRVNEYQSELRAVTRKIMATVSELSMYQASALKLGAEREELESALSVASQRLEAGEPPTGDAEREWYRMERERKTVGSLAEDRRAISAAMDARVSEVQSTADPRPNAYIPENLGIPKPYGGFSPFKPQEPGSTMRHIRKPQPKEVVI
ncbi:hypothetical protein TSOC_001169 [Tetrabaena socialis]|uniref:Cilia- and flagella-associated protein 58 central coiled coil domain-containing protein n=1 Tax=Tetrabaena socialis TaxID=47790 RepID=A0A2J8AHF8_9CHLO|nr:hypothetical protein TSOC_001169 [Tetrabaena socialis]|eukprot:PNH11949.1 hypothetical protein TSOC_001169 [Tetrabaena socialis]